jgi:hypothetical protein
LGDFEVPKLFACGVLERRTRCEFDCSADKCKLASDEDLFRFHPDLKTAPPDHLSIVFTALLPGLNWVTKIDVHIRISVETHDAFHIAGVKAFSELAGNVTQFRDIFQFGLDRGTSIGIKNLLRQMVGLGGLEPPTSPLSGARSSHLSYRPKLKNNFKILAGE